MTWRLKKRGKEILLVLDTRPSKAIRRAKRRMQKRMLEIHKAFEKEAIANE